MLELDRKIFEGLGFDLDKAIADFQKAIEQHRFTVDVPAPTAPHRIVEAIVKLYGGRYEVVDPPIVPTVAHAPLTPHEVLIATFNSYLGLLDLLKKQKLIPEEFGKELYETIEDKPLTDDKNNGNNDNPKK